MHVWVATACLMFALDQPALPHLHFLSDLNVNRFLSGEIANVLRLRDKTSQAAISGDCKVQCETSHRHAAFRFREFRCVDDP